MKAGTAVSSVTVIVTVKVRPRKVCEGEGLVGVKGNGGIRASRIDMAKASKVGIGE